MAVGPATKDTVYEPVPFWAKIPHGIWLKEATSVAVDADDRVYVFNRGNMPVMVFDRDGNLVDSWGNDTPFVGTELFEDPYGNMMPRWKGCRFMRAHAITVANASGDATTESLRQAMQDYRALFTELVEDSSTAGAPR